MRRVLGASAAGVLAAALAAAPCSAAAVRPAPPEEPRQPAPAVPEPLPDSALDAEPLPFEDVEPPSVAALEPGVAGTGVAAEAPVVRSIEIRSDTRDRLAREVRSLLAFAVGDRLTDAAVRRSLRNLQASGVANRVAVYRRPAGGPADGVEGVVAVVVAWANLLVESVDVVGDPGTYKLSELERAVPQRADEPLVESRLVRGVYRVQDLLEKRGYFERSVVLAPEIDEDRRRAKVVYRVEAGPRATIGEVSFDGPTGPFSAGELIERMRLAPGDVYTAEAAETAARRLADRLIAEGYRAARVENPSVDYRRADHTVALTVPLDVGPRVDVTVIGADRKKLFKRGLLPFLGPEGYDEALVLQSIDRLRAYYQRQGHYRVEVGQSEQRRDGVLELTLTIAPGPVFTLTEIRFDGNDQVSDSRLAELMETSQRSLLSLGSGRLVDETLTADLTNLRSYLALQGYVQSKVGPARVEERGERELVLVLPIVEGPRQQVVDLRFEGFEALDLAELRSRLPLAAGGPFHPRRLEDSLNLLRAEYERLGYDQAQVSAATDWNAEHTLVNVGFRALEGPQTVVDRVIVRGNRDTAEEVIRRTSGLASAEPVSRSRLLEVERRLYRLGIFSQVSVELTPAAPGAVRRDVIIRVEEGRVQRVTYGVGYDTEDGYGGLLGYSHANLFGRALSLSLDARVRQQRQQYRLYVEQPTVGRFQVPVTYSVFRFEESRESFDVTKRGLRVDAVKDLGDGLRLSAGYDYRIVENQITADLTRTILREDQTLRIASLISTLQVDHRDDPLSPTRGWSSVAQVEYAFPLFAAEADFVKLFLQQTQYLDLGHWGVLAGSVRGGGIEPLASLDLDDPLVPPGLPSRDVFLAERFFAGGSSTHRAFDRDRLGLPGQSLFPDAGDKLVPAGGNGLLLVNLDYRFPIAGPIGGTVFYDTGNVWADWREIDLGELRDGVGLGVRYESPIGPVRLEIGWPLDRLPGDDPNVIFLSLGNPF